MVPLPTLPDGVKLVFPFLCIGRLIRSSGDGDGEFLSSGEIDVRGV
jgi:hypothetical protein